jgi:hypothetical protein
MGMKMACERVAMLVEWSVDPKAWRSVVGMAMRSVDEKAIYLGEKSVVQMDNSKELYWVEQLVSMLVEKRVVLSVMKSADRWGQRKVS